MGLFDGDSETVKLLIKALDEKHTLMYSNHAKDIHELDAHVFGNGKDGLVTDVDRLVQDRKRQGRAMGLMYTLIGTVLAGLIISYFVGH